MAKINIPFNGTNYNIDESALAETTDKLKTHLSTVMNGTGATINLCGTAYSVDSTKLSTATNTFISHLGTVAGNGYKVVVNGVEYSIGTDKVSGAMSNLETVLDGLVNSGSNEIPNPELCNESNSGTDPVDSWSGSVLGKNRGGSYKEGDAVRIYANNVLVYNRVYTGVNDEYTTQYCSNDLLVVTKADKLDRATNRYTITIDVQLPYAANYRMEFYSSISI